MTGIDNSGTAAGERPMDKIIKVRQRNDAIIRACQSVDPDFVIDGKDQDQERWTVCYNYSDGLGWLPVDNFFNLYGTAWVSTKEKALEACALLTQWKTEELFRGSKTMPRYDHMLDIAFTVISEEEDGSDITPEQIHVAIAKRLVLLAEANEFDIGGAIGISDTYEIEEPLQND